MEQSPSELVELSEHKAEVLYNLEEEQRLPIVDLLSHGLAMTGDEIARKLRISRSTVVRDRKKIRKMRANLEIDFLPAREVAAELVSDAETCFTRALKQKDPVGAFAIRLKLFQELRNLGLIQDAESGKTPVTLAGMRRKLAERLQKMKLLPPGPNGTAAKGNRAGPDPAGGA